MANGLKGMYEAIRNYGAESGSGDRRAVALKGLEKHRTDSGRSRGEADLFSGMLDAQATGGQSQYKPSDFIGKSGEGLGRYGGDYSGRAGGRIFGGEGSKNIEGNVFEHFKNNPQDFSNYYESFGEADFGDALLDNFDRTMGKSKVRLSLQRGMKSYLGDDYDSWWGQNVTTTDKAYNEGRNMNEGVYKREHGKGFRTKDPRIEEAGY